MSSVTFDYKSFCASLRFFKDAWYAKSDFTFEKLMGLSRRLSSSISSFVVRTDFSLTVLFFYD